MARGPKRFIRIDTTDPVFDPIYDLAARSYPGAVGGPSAVTRELVMTSLGQDASDATRISGRRLAYLAGMTFIRLRLSSALSEIASQVQADGIATESMNAATAQGIEGEAA